MIRKIVSVLVVVVVVCAGGVLMAFYYDSESATVDVAEGYGTDPKLPPPNRTTFPTVNVAEGEKPAPAGGLAVEAFATGLDHPRTLAIDSQGALLVADDVGNTIWRVTPATQQAANNP